MPDGFSISGQFHPVPPGADFAQRIEEALIDSNIVAIAGDDGTDPVTCIVETGRFCLSPLAKADEAAAEAMYRMSLTTAAEEETLCHCCDQESQIRFTFALPAQLFHFLRRTLPEIEFVHDLYDMHQAHSLQQGMVVKAMASSVSLLAYRDNKLQLCNRIEARGTVNQTYFIMSAWGQLGFDPIEDSLQLVSDNSELRDNLNKYIKCVL